MEIKKEANLIGSHSGVSLFLPFVSLSINSPVNPTNYRLRFGFPSHQQPPPLFSFTDLARYEKEPFWCLVSGKRKKTAEREKKKVLFLLRVVSTCAAPPATVGEEPRLK